MISLTFDTDYMCEDDLQRFAEEFAFVGQATYFLWRPFRGLRIGDHELAPHPFLNEADSWRRSLDLFEEAWGRKGSVLRPHSCTYSHMLGIELARRGYKGISQVTALGMAGLRPYRHPWGIWELPIFYMDSMDVTFSRNWPGLYHRPFSRQIIDTAVTDSEGLYVFDFHPLHIVLNTSSYDQYQTLRVSVVEDRVSPFKLTQPGRGCRTFFEELVGEMDRKRQPSHSCGDVLATADP